MDAIEARLDRIEAKLSRLVDGPPPDIVGAKQMMGMTGCRSLSALYRMIPLLGVKPYRKGKYRRIEVENAVAKLALKERLNPENK